MFNNLGKIFKNFSMTNPLVFHEVICTPMQTSMLYFSSSELQQIKEVLRKQLAAEEYYSKVLQCTARNAKSDGHVEKSNLYYKDLHKSKKRIKALAAIQTKIKHSILTLG